MSYGFFAVLIQRSFNKLCSATISKDGSDIIMFIVAYQHSRREIFRYASRGNDVRQDKEITGVIEPKEITLAFLSCVRFALWQPFLHIATLLSRFLKRGLGVYVRPLSSVYEYRPLGGEK